VGDAEAMPYDDNSFDVVMTMFRAMFVRPGCCEQLHGLQTGGNRDGEPDDAGRCKLSGNIYPAPDACTGALGVPRKTGDGIAAN
jgi:hypothetical protein